MSQFAFHRWTLVESKFLSKDPIRKLMEKKELNILIVDDDASICSVLEAAIKRAGYKTLVVHHPNEAKSLVKIKSIHAALVDCVLPAQNGVDLVKELRESSFDSTIVFMMSGIFKDNSYIAQAKRSTGAVEFLLKPIDISKLINKIDEQLASFVETPKVDLHSLLSKPMASQRDRRRALDHIEDMTGWDLLFVFHIIMESKCTGHLNIVKKGTEINGVTFIDGQITRVDSENIGTTIKKILLKNKYVSSEDIQQVSAKPGEILEAFVNESLISPHLVKDIKCKQILFDLELIMSRPDNIQINFVPQKELKVEHQAPTVDLNKLANITHNIINHSIEFNWFREFYNMWMDHPLRIGPQFSEKHPVLQLALVSDAKELLDEIHESSTVEEILEKGNIEPKKLFKALHLLAVCRLIVFDEFKKTKNLGVVYKRLSKIYEAIQGKNPYEVFAYFGLNRAVSSSEATRIFKDFVKSNHPDSLPSSASKELRELNHKIFSIVSGAHDTLANKDKRADLDLLLQQNRANSQIKAEEMAKESAIKLKTGKYSDALAGLKASYKMSPQTTTQLYTIWAQIKSQPNLGVEDVIAIQKTLADIPSETKRTALFYFVNGLFLRVIKQPNAAKKAFEKTLTIEKDNLDARRELASMKKVKTKTDIFNGDVSGIFTNFFQKKK